MPSSYVGPSALRGAQACNAIDRTALRPAALPSGWASRRHACRRHAAAARPAALFGFGKADAATSPKAAAVPETGPLLIPFTPVQKTADYSLRLFSAYPVAECEYERRDEGFLMLGSYMSGNNAAEARCRETQPVVMAYDPQGPKRMRIYVVPRSSSSSSCQGGDSPAPLPPAPNNSDVSLTIAGGEVVAVRKFEGNATQEACERCRQVLIAALQRDGLALAEAEAGGYFRLAQYGPLHSLQTRVNEIWLAVKL